jgi:hypothetical protein
MQSRGDNGKCFDGAYALTYVSSILKPRELGSFKD